MTPSGGHRINLALAALGVVSLTNNLSAGVVRYTLTDLGTLGGGTSEAYGLNNLGQVVGGAANYVETRAFLWQNGVMTDLQAGRSRAKAVNDLGQVVGVSQAFRYPFLWDNGVITQLPLLPGGNEGSANAVNNSGQVVGASIPNGGYPRAVMWENGAPIDLGALGGYSSTAYDINNSGQVVGAYFLPKWPSRAFIWQDGVMTQLPGTGTAMTPYAINDMGQVVGRAGNQSFFWDNGVTTGIGTLGGGISRAYDVNNAGRVVGTAQRSDGTYHAFMWENGVMHDLNDLLENTVFPGWYMTEAWSINDAGWIVGWGMTGSGSHHRAVLLIPEPVTLCLLAAGSLTVARRRRGGGMA